MMGDWLTHVTNLTNDVQDVWGCDENRFYLDHSFIRGGQPYPTNVETSKIH